MGDEEKEKSKHGLAMLEQQTREFEKLISENESGDPQKLKEYIDAIDIARDAAERWTDNIYAIIKFIKSKKSMTEAEILKYFGLPSDFDYIE